MFTFAVFSDTEKLTRGAFFIKIKLAPLWLQIAAKDVFFLQVREADSDKLRRQRNEFLTKSVFAITKHIFKNYNTNFDRSAIKSEN